MIATYVRINENLDIVNVYKTDTDCSPDTDNVMCMADYKTKLFTYYYYKIHGERNAALTALQVLADDFVKTFILHLESPKSLRACGIKSKHLAIGHFDYECHKWGI